MLETPLGLPLRCGCAVPVAGGCRGEGSCRRRWTAAWGAACGGKGRRMGQGANCTHQQGVNCTHRQGVNCTHSLRAPRTRGSSSWGCRSRLPAGQGGRWPAALRCGPAAAGGQAGRGGRAATVAGGVKRGHGLVLEHVLRKGGVCAGSALCVHMRYCGAACAAARPLSLHMRYCGAACAALAMPAMAAQGSDHPLATCLNTARRARRIKR
jgi:hypothetical protein